MVLAYNDEPRIKEFIESVKGVDEIIISLDEFSSDKTGEIAESMGAKVVGRSNFWEHPTREDIDNFTKRYFAPEFTTEHKFCHSGKVRNEALSYAKNDWVFFPDSDEIVTWDLKHIKSILPNFDQISCNYIQSRDDSGKPTNQFDICKLFRKSRITWKGRVHEVATPMKGNRLAHTHNMKIDHYHTHRIVDPKQASRGQVSMEYAVLKDNDTRTKCYLAREYMYNKKNDKAIKMYLEYLREATWLPEIVEAHIQISRCYWLLNEGSKAREHCLEAVRNNPQCKEALYLMSVYYNEPWATKWRNLSKSCTNEDSLFKPEWTY